MSVKKMVAVVLAVLTLGLAVPFAGVSAEDAAFNVVIVPGKDIVTRGNTVTFTVLATDINARGGLLSLDVPFRFDTGVFELVGKSVIYPDEWADPVDFSYTSPKNGLLWLRALDQSGNFTENGCDRDNAVGFKITLRVKMDAPLGDSTVTVNGDGGFEVISGTASDGLCTEVGGTGTPVSVRIEEFEVLLGDVNDDGLVDNLDAASVLKHDAGITELSEEALKRGDINGDGFVDNLDATVILKIDAGVA